MIPALLACALMQAAAGDAEAWRIFATIDAPGEEQPAAWENWPSAADTFRRDGADPGPSQRLSHPGMERFELITPADFPNLRHIVDGRMVPVTDPLALAQRLVEVRLNKVSYDFIRARELYTVAGQRRAVAQGKVEFPVGSIQLKAGWRPIAESERLRYHTLTLRLADGSTRRYGLAALNIAAKTPPAGCGPASSTPTQQARGTTGCAARRRATSTRSTGRCGWAMPCWKRASGTALRA